MLGVIWRVYAQSSMSSFDIVWIEELGEYEGSPLLVTSKVDGQLEMLARGWDMRRLLSPCRSRNHPLFMMHSAMRTSSRTLFL